MTRCEKRGYLSRDIAGEVVARMKIQGIATDPKIAHLNAYRCAACGRWHVGNASKPRYRWKPIRTAKPPRDASEK